MRTLVHALLLAGSLAAPTTNPFQVVRAEGMDGGGGLDAVELDETTATSIKNFVSTVISGLMTDATCSGKKWEHKDMHKAQKSFEVDAIDWAKEGVVAGMEELYECGLSTSAGKITVKVPRPNQAACVPRL